MKLPNYFRYAESFATNLDRIATDTIGQIDRKRRRCINAHSLSPFAFGRATM